MLVKGLLFPPGYIAISVKQKLSTHGTERGKVGGAVRVSWCLVCPCASAHDSDVTCASWPMKSPTTRIFSTACKAFQQREGKSLTLLALYEGNPQWGIHWWPWIPFTKGKFSMSWHCVVSVVHYDDVIMSAITSQITCLTIVYSTVYPGADQSKHQSSASLVFVWGIHRRPVNSPHKWPVTRKKIPFDDVIMANNHSSSRYPSWCVYKTLCFFLVLTVSLCQGSIFICAIKLEMRSGLVFSTRGKR